MTFEVFTEAVPLGASAFEGRERFENTERWHTELGLTTDRSGEKFDACV